MFNNFFNNINNAFLSSVNQMEENIEEFSSTINQATNFVNSNININQNNNNKQMKFKDHILFNTDVISQESCPICFDDFKEGEIASILPCYHIFHRQCIDPWIKKQNNCPNCRIDNSYRWDKLSKEEIDRQARKNKENIYFGKNSSVDLNLIDKLSVKHLKFLLNEFNIDHSNCLYKEDLKNLIKNDIFYVDKSTEVIKKFLNDNKVNSDDCLERRDLLKLVASIQLIIRLF